MVTHFSFGSFFSSHGLSNSPFLTLLEWKYLFGMGRVNAEDEPSVEADREAEGVENGFVRIGVPGIDVIISVSAYGSLRLCAYGDPGTVVVAIDEAVRPLIPAPSIVTAEFK